MGFGLGCGVRVRACRSARSRWKICSSSGSKSRAGPPSRSRLHQACTHTEKISMTSCCRTWVRLRIRARVRGSGRGRGRDRLRVRVRFRVRVRVRVRVRFIGLG